MAIDFIKRLNPSLGINTALITLIQLTILLLAISGFVPIYFYLNDLAFILILFCVLLVTLKKGIPQPRMIHGLILMYCATLLISHFKTDIPLSRFTDLLIGTRGPFLFLAFSFILPTKKSVINIIKVFLMIGFFSAPIALYQEFIYIKYGKNLFLYPIVIEIFGVSVPRVKSFMYGCNFFSFCLGLSFILLIHYIQQVKSMRRITSIFLLIIIGVALLLTFTRTVWLALILTLFWRYRFKLMIKYTKGIFIGIVALLLLFGIFYFRGANAIQSRLLLLKESIDIFQSDPILGKGIGNVLPYTSEYTRPHNQFLEIATNCGIFSLFFYILIFYYIFLELREIHKSNSSLSLALKNCLLFLLIVFMFEGLMLNIVPWIIFGLIDLSYRSEKLSLTT